MDRVPPEAIAKWEAKHGLGATWGDQEDRAVGQSGGSHVSLISAGSVPDVFVNGGDIVVAIPSIRRRRKHRQGGLAGPQIEG